MRGAGRVTPIWHDSGRFTPSVNTDEIDARSAVEAMELPLEGYGIPMIPDGIQRVWSYFGAQTMPLRAVGVGERADRLIERAAAARTADAAQK